MKFQDKPSIVFFNRYEKDFLGDIADITKNVLPDSAEATALRLEAEASYRRVHGVIGNVNCPGVDTDEGTGYIKLMQERDRLRAMKKYFDQDQQNKKKYKYLSFYGDDPFFNADLAKRAIAKVPRMKTIDLVRAEPRVFRGSCGWPDKCRISVYKHLLGSFDITFHECGSAYGREEHFHEVKRSLEKNHKIILIPWLSAYYCSQPENADEIIDEYKKEHGLDDTFVYCPVACRNHDYGNIQYDFTIVNKSKIEAEEILAEILNAVGRANRDQNLIEHVKKNFSEIEKNFLRYPVCEITPETKRMHIGPFVVDFKNHVNSTELSVWLSEEYLTYLYLNNEINTDSYSRKNPPVRYLDQLIELMENSQVKQPFECMRFKEDDFCIAYLEQASRRFALKVKQYGVSFE